MPESSFTFENHQNLTTPAGGDAETATQFSKEVLQNVCHLICRQKYTSIGPIIFYAYGYLYIHMFGVKWNI